MAEPSVCSVADVEVIEQRPVREWIVSRAGAVYYEELESVQVMEEEKMEENKKKKKEANKKAQVKRKVQERVKPQARPWSDISRSGGCRRGQWQSWRRRWRGRRKVPR